MNNFHFQKCINRLLSQTKISTKVIFLDATASGVPHVDWYRPQIRQFCLLAYTLNQKWVSSLQIILLPNIGSTSKCCKALSANTRRFAWSFTLSSWINWTSYGWYLKSSCKILRAKVAENLSSCERRQIDRFGFPLTLLRTVAMFSADLAFRRGTGVGWLLVYWATWLNSFCRTPVPRKIITQSTER